MVATRSAGKTRGGGARSTETQDELARIQQMEEEMHSFRDQDGFWHSAWLLQVTVKQHKDIADEEGERIASSMVSTSHDYRLYRVDRDQLIRVTLRNLSETELELIPVYVSDTGDEQPEDPTTLRGGEEYELPYPLQKEAGEEEDAWAIKDDEGRTVLKLRFVLGA